MSYGTNYELLKQSLNRAIGGGMMGTTAMGIQVCSMMWLRTTINYQYKNGTTMKNTLKILYNEGGIPRFYRGLVPALLQAPLSRFGDIAMNTGMLYYLNNNNSTKDLPLSVKTFCGSLFAGLWRINLMPIDTCKTIMQVQGKNGYNILKNKVKTGGIRVLYHGSLGACGATIMGHFPWFYTHNFLSKHIPKSEEDNIIKKMSRYALIGFCSSMVSDTVSNSARVIKTTKQSNKKPTTYVIIVKNIVKKDGIHSLFSRGLKTKIISNGIQSIIFTIIWKSLEDVYFN